MSSTHSFLVAAACALPLSIAACGSSSSESAIVPEGTHYGYVVSSASLPTTMKEQTEFALDLGGAKSSKLDGTVDNKLGGLLSLLSSYVDLKGAINKAIDTGSIILLVDFQTKDLANSSAAGFAVKIGATPTPPACTDMNDTTCRHHLDGHGSFQIAAGTPTDAEVAGKIVSTAFTGGPGDVTLQLAVGGATITLNLLRARVQATISATGITNAKIGGLLTQTEITTQLVPAIQVQVANLLTTSCTGSGPSCGCTGTGPLFLIAFDTNGDCKLSTEEILNADIVKTSLAPDICTTDACTTADGLSIGVQVQTVKATFPDAM